MAKTKLAEKTGHTARARAVSAPMSTKQAIEICHHIRYKTTSVAKRALEDTISLKKAIPFKHFNRDLGHKPGMAAGRFPQKAAKIMLNLVKSLEANAQDLGLDTSSLKISKAIANKAASPMTGGRRRTSTKRTHVELEVVEHTPKPKKARNASGKKTAPAKPKAKPTEKRPAAPKEVAKKEAEEKPTVAPTKEAKPVPDQKVDNTTDKTAAAPAETAK